MPVASLPSSCLAAFSSLCLCVSVVFCLSPGTLTVAGDVNVVRYGVTNPALPPMMATPVGLRLDEEPTQRAAIAGVDPSLTLGAPNPRETVKQMHGQSRRLPLTRRRRATYP